MKGIEDLDLDDPGSIGGAMGSWPFRTLWWACRWERTGQTDPSAVHQLNERNVSALVDLQAEVERRSWSSETLVERTRALSGASVEDITEALQTAYTAHYGRSCPFEREGMDLACHRCPVAAEALQSLVSDTDSEGPEEVELP